MTEQVHNYLEAVGRRKRSVARVRLHHSGSGSIMINDRDLSEYFPLETLQQSIMSPLRETGTENVFDITVHTNGGGIHGQADAIRLGISKCLVEFNPEFRTVLKALGFLTTDARKRERKKYGLRGARRAPQWSKR
ncbi:MAG: 30S ribosomal protein S9 [Parcubacteria group bacterium]|nr:30S ribosomal protein S9 [Parcubacteria group bacterium]